MKMLWALLALALVQFTGARGLKAPRAPDASAVLSKQLEAENEALKKQNQHLEAMMQMARAEVHRMDAAATKQQHTRSCGESEVLKQEIVDLKKKMQATESEKMDLVQTLRRMLAKNSTKIFQRQAERAQETTMAVELRCGKEREALEAQVRQANEKVKEAASQCDDTKEEAQKIQQENEDLRIKIRHLQAENAKVVAANQDLTSNKAQLIATMQSLMRESSRFKHDLQKETDSEAKEAKELLTTKSQLAKLQSKSKSKSAPAQKPVKRALKASPRHHKHEMSEAAQIAHMKDINSYIVNAEAPDDNDEDAATEHKLSAVQKQGELFDKGKVGTHLSDWLGVKKQAEKIKSKTASSAGKKAVQKNEALSSDDQETEAEAILKEAKANLAALEKADTGSSDSV